MEAANPIDCSVDVFECRRRGRFTAALRIASKIGVRSSNSPMNLGQSNCVKFVAEVFRRIDCFPFFVVQRSMHSCVTSLLTASTIAFFNLGIVRAFFANEKKFPFVRSTVILFSVVPAILYTFLWIPVTSST